MLRKLRKRRRGGHRLRLSRQRQAAPAEMPLLVFRYRARPPRFIVQ
jgi:hypothetical protein